MELEISIEDLLNKRRVESDRIEFKAGWNPDEIYHSICAFANDFDNIGGGYILIGVEEKNGVAVRPVKGIEEKDNLAAQILPEHQSPQDKAPRNIMPFLQRRRRKIPRRKIHRNHQQNGLMDHGSCQNGQNKLAVFPPKHIFHGK